MLKFLIFLPLLIASPFLLIEAYSLEVEFVEESERIIESKGWLEPKKVALQEQLQIIIDYDNSRNKISVSMLSKNPNDLRFPDHIESIVKNSKIVSFIVTNEFGCAPSKIERACVIVDVERQGLGDNLIDIRKNTREITDQVAGVLLFGPEFDSVRLHQKTNFSGENVIVSRATYTINKPPTTTFLEGIGNVIVSSNIRTSGGFYNHAEKLAQHDFSAFSISLIPDGESMLRTMHISLICSDKLPEYPRCPGNVTEQITNGEISPLDFIGVESINRNEMFGDEFLPLNSIIHVTIFSEQDLEIKTIHTNLIEKLDHIGDIQNSGWIFTESSNKIEGRYIFGSNTSVSKNDLVFSFGPNTNDAIDIRMGNNGGGCLIATAAFGSEIAPQVQFLREFRDDTVLQTQSGASFMGWFNQFYYSFSPVVADYERENIIFKESIKLTLTPLLTSLTLLSYTDIDSESEMLGYGIAIILLNIGMYFVAPAIVIMKIKKRI